MAGVQGPGVSGYPYPAERLTPIGTDPCNKMPLGIILGAPIAATLLVIVREAYVEDVLGRSQCRHLSLDAAMDP
jgi:hypothetical protein